MAKTTGLIFSLFDIASAQEVPFSIPQYVQCIPQGLTSVLLCVPFIFASIKKRQFGGCTWWLLLLTQIINIFHYGYLDYKGTFQTVLDLYCCATSLRAMDTSVSDDNWGMWHHLYFSWCHSKQYTQNQVQKLLENNWNSFWLCEYRKYLEK